MIIHKKTFRPLCLTKSHHIGGGDISRTADMGEGTSNPEEMWEGEERLKQQVLPSYPFLAPSHCFLTSHALVTKSAAHRIFWQCRPAGRAQ